MDRKSIIILVVCFLLLFSWPVLVNKIYPPKPLPPGSTNVQPSLVTATNPPTTGSSAPVATIQAPAPRPLPFSTDVPEQVLEYTNANAHYTFSSRGGGLELVELLKYPESVSRRDRRSGSRRVAALNTFSPAPVLTLLDGQAVQGDGVYTLSRLPKGIRAEKILTNGLTITKDFEVSSNYLVLATVRLHNRSDQPLALASQEWVVGTATPSPVNTQDDTLGLMWYNGNKLETIAGSSHFSDKSFACTPRVPPPEYRGGQSNVVWAAMHSQFFALAVMPKQPALQVVMRKLPLPAPTLEEVQADSRVIRSPVAYDAALVFPASTLDPGASLQRDLVIYAGPKEYRTLATVSAVFGNELDAIMGFGVSGFSAFFGWFSKALLLCMNWLHTHLSLSYGWAIIAITFIIKLLFWPLTQASTRSAKRMQALQPQIKALQEKYKDDPVKAQRKMMEFWKEHKVNPMSGCLPTLIQMPVFIGFFYMIRSAIELRGASWFWVSDLSRPDTLFLIPGINFPFNLLPLVMGATMLWQAQLMPPSPGMDPTQAKIMRYMPLMFMVFLYNFSAGLTLYWTVQNLLSIVQTKLTHAKPEKPAPAKAPVLTTPPKKRK